MRGKQPDTRQPSRCCRITPAHAGKTVSAEARAPPSADHPRACGENNGVTYVAQFNGGSPPRMRGKLSSSAAVRPCGRITPAHAGKTFSKSAAAELIADHPRACGENIGGKATALKRLGSPPRMRGKQPLSSHCRCSRRITPAHAGKTKAASTHERGTLDHPRACGENRLISMCPKPCYGSPPRMRGKLPCSPQSYAIRRITPAHAGKTLYAVQRTQRRADHPRACGENIEYQSLQTEDAGSPPRMRGKRRALTPRP